MAEKLDFSKTTIAELVQKSLFPLWESDRRKMLRLDRWHRNELVAGSDLPELKKGTREYKVLQRISTTPWARLVVSSTVDQLSIEGIVDGDGKPDVDMWNVWQMNRMQARQTPLLEAATALGRSYLVAEPGVDELSGTPMPKLKLYPATQSFAYYEDPVNDDWPMYAMFGTVAHKSDGQPFWRMSVYADINVYTVDVVDGDATFISYQEHGAPVPPVVQFAPNVDLQGRATGEVEPYIGMFSRMNQTTLDRHIVERFGAWVVRWATGLETPQPVPDENGNAPTEAEARQAAKLRLSIEDILVSSGEGTKFGTLEGTPMDPYIAAEEWQARNLAVITQSTPSQFVGQVENLAADAIAALNAPHRGKLGRHKKQFGEQAEQAFRLIGLYQGKTVDASAQVLWGDSESRSLSQLADALNKLVTGLKIPPQELWPRVAEALGRPQQDVEAWKAAAADPDELGRMMQELLRQNSPTDPGA